MASCLVPSSACRPKAEPPPLDEPSAHAALDASSALDAPDARAEDAYDANTAMEASLMPYGELRVDDRTRCGGAYAEHLAREDRLSSFVDGSSLLAEVNRAPTGALAPDFAPADLVDLRTGKATSASDCDKVQCLRKEAAVALSELLGSMKSAGFPGKVQSAFRSYGAQCGTFLRWAKKGSFCDATEQSALPGHSQHQLGTTLDLFTEVWATDPRGVFRSGFGCTDAGQFLSSRAWEHGFVLPYPIHPDDRNPARDCTTRSDIQIFINPKTGYRYEHWHLRYIGKDAARQFHEAREASGVGSPNEWTLEQWLRSVHGRDRSEGDAPLPVCDGCNDGACATLSPATSSSDKAKRGAFALHLEKNGTFLGATAEPRVVASGWRASAHGAKAEHTGPTSSPRQTPRLLALTVEVPENLATQPPILDEAGAGYADGATYEAFTPFPKTTPRAFAPLSRAWSVGVEPVPNTTNVAWPWRAGLSEPAIGRIYNRANVMLPAKPGQLTLLMAVPRDTTRVRITLLRRGQAVGMPIELARP